MTTKLAGWELAALWNIIDSDRLGYACWIISSRSNGMCTFGGSVSQQVTIVDDSIWQHIAPVLINGIVPKQIRTPEMIFYTRITIILQ